MPLNSTMVAVALPDISVEFGRDPALVTQGLFTSYLIASVVLQSPAGKLGDRVRSRAHGRRRPGSRGGRCPRRVPGARALGCSIVARIAMAAGGAALVPSTVAMLRHDLPVERRGRAFGAFGAMMALSAALGTGGRWRARRGVRVAQPVRGEPAGPRSSPWVWSSSPAASRVQESAIAHPRFDWIGTGLLAGGLTRDHPGTAARRSAPAPAARRRLGLLVPFGWWERRAADPVVAFSLFRSVPFAAGAFLIAAPEPGDVRPDAPGHRSSPPLCSTSDARGTGRLIVSMMLAMVITSPDRRASHRSRRRHGRSPSPGRCRRCWASPVSPGSI